MSLPMGRAMRDGFGETVTALAAEDERIVMLDVLPALPALPEPPPPPPPGERGGAGSPRENTEERPFMPLSAFRAARSL